MYSAQDDAALPAPGFPIRRSTGQRLFSASPWLIAAVHVLRRLLVPRHPPCALHILTVKSSPGASLAAASRIRCLSFFTTVQFSRSGERLYGDPRDEGAAGLSKLNSMQAGKPL